jgi:N-acetylglucosamine-6-phosphate deacetylase
VRVTGGIARLANEETFAGSTLTMDRAFRFAMDAGIGLDEAVRMASTTPAGVLGMADRVGSVAVGLDADLLVLDETFRVRAVMTKGAWLDGSTA